MEQKSISINDIRAMIEERPRLAMLMDAMGLTENDVREIANIVLLTKSGKAVNDAFKEHAEHLPHQIRGKWRDIITYPCGSPEEHAWNENLVVNSFSILLSALCLYGRTPSYQGITYMALGQGSSSWDTGGTPAPSASDTILVSEIARNALSSVQDITSGGSVVTTGPTGNLLLTGVFSQGEANGDIREFGLFGGVAASGYTMSQVNQGTMVDHINHGVIAKLNSSDFTLTRQVQLLL